MGSRLMHYALGRTLAERLDIHDREGFILGSILPDALPADKKQELNSHFITVFDEGRFKWFDSLGFYEKYEDDIKHDAIYLGYYFHLIADNIFRQTFYIDMGLLYRRGEKSLFQEFYNDYNILNPYIAAEYGLDKTLTVPSRLVDTALFSAYGFEPEKLIEDIYADLDMHIDGETAHFNMDIVRGFVEKSSGICEREFSAIAECRHVYNRYDLAIENCYSSKTEG